MANYIKNNTRVKEIHNNATLQPTPQPTPQPTIDISALANAVAAAISLKIPSDLSKNDNLNFEVKSSLDTFDTSKTMSRLADHMLIERGNGKSNFEDLGNITKTKKDQKDVDNTIDLLKNLDD